MIDYPLQFVASVVGIVLIVAFLWRTRKSRLVRIPVGWRRAGCILTRLSLFLVVLVLLVVALDATRFLTANICLEFNAGNEWCLHAEHDSELDIDG